MLACVLFRVPFRGSVVIASGRLTRGALRGPHFRRLFPDVYIAAEVVLDHLVWCQAASLYAGPDAVISGLSAAYVWGVNQLPLNGGLPEVGVPVELTSPSKVRSPRAVVVRSALEPLDVTLRCGVPVTTGVRTGFDVARRLPRRSAIATLDALTHLHVATIRDIRQYAVSHPAQRGCTQVASVLAQVEPASESPMESHTRVLLVDGGLPRPEAQIEVFDQQGELIGRLDLGYRRLKIGLEYEGDHHRSKEVFRRDLARGNALRAAGWIIVRVTADDVFRTPVRFVRAVARVIDERRREMDGRR
jgi:very-short-patch-repair endonuclease